jgi:hypothetical protein
MCLSILGGDWTKGSKKLLQSSGEKIIEIPLSHFVSVFAREGIELQWAEKDRETPKRSWEKFGHLTPQQIQNIGENLLSDHKEDIVATVKSTLTQDMTGIKIKRIELAIELENGRTIVQRFANEEEFSNFLKTLDLKKLR